MTDEDRVLAAAAAVLDDRDIVVDRDILGSYRHDRSTGSPAGEPFAVVFPRTTDQVAAIMTAAHRHRVPVVPARAGSGLSGGSNAIDGSLVLCLERMREVIGVDVVNGYVETQPGIMNTELRDHVAEHGLWYAPDPASKDFCSIGGNVNTNAGGLCCVKYGTTRESVLGLEVVLADGRVTNLGRRTVKGVAGYDLAGMMVGSEGTLGIVTMARLRLRPLPPPPVTAVAVFADTADAGRAAADVMAEVTPSVLELMDNATIRIVENWRPMGLDTSAGCVLMAQFDNGPGAAEVDADRFVAIAERAGASEIHRSETPEEAELLLGARRMAILAIEEAGTGCSTTSRCRGRASPRRFGESRTSPPSGRCRSAPSAMPATATCIRRSSPSAATPMPAVGRWRPSTTSLRWHSTSEAPSPGSTASET